MFKKTSCLICAVIFLFVTILPPDSVYAQNTKPLSAYLNLLTISKPLVPLTLRGIEFDPNDICKLNFVLDQGGTVLDERQFNEQLQTLMYYFTAALSMPSRDLWVNLSPYEHERIAPEQLSIVQIGQDLLAQDYVLKQLSSSLTYPETELGRKYWDSVGARSPRPGQGNPAPTNTFNKIWIIPDKAVVYQAGNQAIIKSSRMKLMIDADYLAMSKNGQGESGDASLASGAAGKRSVPISGTDAFKTHILPVIEKEVNEGANFAKLRQIYSALILAVWFKHKLKDTILNQAYFDKKKTSGIEAADKDAKEKIYAQYLEAFQKGAYNYTKTVGAASMFGKVIKRTYFSGGANLAAVDGLVQAQAVSVSPASVDAIKSSIPKPAQAQMRLSPVRSSGKGSSLLGFTRMIAVLLTLGASGKILAADNKDSGQTPGAQAAEMKPRTDIEGEVRSALGKDVLKDKRLGRLSVTANGRTDQLYLLGHLHAADSLRLFFSEVLYKKKFETLPAKMQTNYARELQQNKRGEVDAQVKSYRDDIALIAYLVKEKNLTVIAEEGSIGDLNKRKAKYQNILRRIHTNLVRAGVPDAKKETEYWGLFLFGPVLYMHTTDSPVLKGVKVIGAEDKKNFDDSFNVHYAFLAAENDFNDECDDLEITEGHALFSARQNITKAIDQILREDRELSDSDIDRLCQPFHGTKVEKLAKKYLEKTGIQRDITIRKRNGHIIENTIAAARPNPGNMLVVLGRAHFESFIKIGKAKGGAITGSLSKPKTGGIDFNEDNLSLELTGTSTSPARVSDLDLGTDDILGFTPEIISAHRF